MAARIGGRMPRAAAAALFSAAAFAAPLPTTAQESPLVDARPSGWAAAAAWARPAAEEPFAAAVLSGGAAVDGFVDAGPGFGFKLGVEAWANLAGAADPVDARLSFPDEAALEWTGNDRLVAAAELKEAWIDFSLGDFDFSLGRRLFSWGQADGVNPTDAVNPRRVGTRPTSTLDERKIGVWAFEAAYGLPGNLGSVQALFLPLPNVNRLPSMAMDLDVPSTGPGVPAVRVSVRDAERPAFAPDRVEGGLRALAYAGPLSVSASWFSGADRFPDFAVSTASVPAFGGPPTLVTTTLTGVHKRMHQFGFDAAYLAGGWDLRTEWALALTEDPEGRDPAVKNPSVSGVAQLSRSFLDGTLTATASYAPRFVLGYKAPEDYAAAADAKIAAMLREYDGQAYAAEHALGGRVAAKLLAETLQLDATFLAEPVAADWLGTATATLNLADGVNLKAGAGLYGSFLAEGDPARAYGTFSNARTIDQDYVFLELRLSF